MASAREERDRVYRKNQGFRGSLRVYTEWAKRRRQPAESSDIGQLAFVSGKLSFEGLSFPVVGEPDPDDDPLRVQSEFKVGRKASLSIKPLSHFGHFVRQRAGRRTLTTMVR